MKNKFFIAAFNIYLSIFSSLLLIIGLVSIRIITNFKLILTIIGIVAVISFSTYSYFSKQKNLYNTGIFICFLLNILSIYCVIDLNTKYSYINNILTHEYQYETYNIYVQRKTTTYSNIEKLSGKKIGLLENNTKNIKEYLNNYIDIECVSYSSMEEITSSLENGNIQSFIVTEEEYDSISEKPKTRVIFTSKIKNTTNK